MMPGFMLLSDMSMTKMMPEDLVGYTLQCSSLVINSMFYELVVEVIHLLGEPVMSMSDSCL